MNNERHEARLINICTLSSLLTSCKAETECLTIDLVKCVSDTKASLLLLCQSRHFNTGDPTADHHLRLFQLRAQQRLAFIIPPLNGPQRKTPAAVHNPYSDFHYYCLIVVVLRIWFVSLISTSHNRPSAYQLQRNATEHSKTCKSHSHKPQQA
jgi:hypothetical protein